MCKEPPTSSSNTAILFFARSEGDEVNNKDIPGRDYRQRAEVCAVLNRHMWGKLNNTGLAVIASTGLEISGEDFASRFVSAIQAVFDLGFSKVISVGNDSPDMDTGLIYSAAGKLETIDGVVGPSIDGGAYLIGVRRDAFDPAAWLELPWQTARLGESLREIFHAGRCHVFDEVYGDLDSLNDWNTWLRSTSLHGLVEQIVKVLFSTEESETLPVSFEIREPVHASADRAPPVLTM